MDWRTDFDEVKINQPVFLLIDNTLHIGAKLMAEDGWLWHLAPFPGFGFHLDAKYAHLNDFECDDDYSPSHWAPMTELP